MLRFNYSLFSFLFTLTLSLNSQAAPLQLYEIDGTASGENFGDALACIPKFAASTLGSDIAAGSPNYPASGAGRAQVFNGLTEAVVISDVGINANEHLGAAVSSTLEDISLTPDGIPDLVVGRNNTAFGTPFATVYYSPDAESTGSIFAVGLSTTGSVSGFGYSIVPLGHKKIAIGAPFFEKSTGTCGAPNANCGGFEVFDLTAAPYSTSLGFYIDAGNGAEAGKALAPIKDLYADGEMDLIVGAPKKNAAAGQVMIFSSASFQVGVPTLSPGVIINGAAAGDEFGSDLAVVGDTNADSFDDIIVGAPQSQTGSGQVTLFAGSNSTSLATLCTINAPSGVRSFGSSVAGLGDMDLDGFPDFAVGAPAPSTPGAVYIYRYDSPSKDCVLEYTILGAPASLSLGKRIVGSISDSHICDLNADGTPDFLVTEAADGPGTGRVHAYAGVRALPTATPTPYPTPILNRQARLQYRLATDGVFRARLVVEPQPSPSCQITILGRRTNRDLKQRSKTVTLISSAVNARATQFVARQMPKVNTVDNIIFHTIARVTCGGTTIFSNVRSRYIRACGNSKYGSVTPEAWETELISKLAALG